MATPGTIAAPRPISVHLVAGARPNFMKIAPVYHVLERKPWCEPGIVHAGQHYDANMSDAFFADLGLPAPDYHLGVGSGTHAEQTGRVMMAYEAVCRDRRPDWIVVVGDVNSTMACALVGAKLRIPVAHLEAGLRSGDRSMPEEINRIVTDAVADLLWTPSPDADENLLAEGVAAERIVCVGNVMIDSFERLAPRISSARMAARLGLDGADYAVVTLHRPSNVDSAATLGSIVDQLLGLSRTLPLVFPVHPRTRVRLEELGLAERLTTAVGIHLTQPLSYIEFMSLVVDSRLAITDSGGIQEETSYLGIPCLTLRANTERPITVTAGTNRLIEPAALHHSVADALKRKPVPARIPLWDGRAAYRVAESLRARAIESAATRERRLPSP